MDSDANDALVKLTRSLVRVDSVNGNETEVALIVADCLGKAGVRSRLYGADKGRRGLIAEVKGGSGNTLLLNGHLDTVPFGDSSKWRHPPLSAKVSGDRIYGRGTYDMKGGVAALACSITDVLEHDIPFSGKIVLLLTYDEEKSHEGVKAAVKSLRADGCVMAEPSKEALGVGYRGSYSFELETTGETAHSGSLIVPGVNAVTKMAKLLLALEKVNLRCKKHPLFPPPRINPGTQISGGTAVNIIPDRCRAIVNCRLSVGQNRRSVREDVEAALRKEVRADPQIRYRIRDLNYTPYFLTPLDEGIVVSTLNAVKSVNGKEPLIKVSGGASDGNLISHAGIPTVNFGPKGARLHQENEYVEISSLSRCAEVYKRVIADYLRRE
jgi:acetylornithine deacetylase/succinyl-diaminopimelate desuccinylase family protein